MKMEEDAHKLLADLKNRNETSTDENDMLKRIMDRLMWKREFRGKNNIKNYENRCSRAWRKADFDPKTSILTGSGDHRCLHRAPAVHAGQPVRGLPMAGLRRVLRPVREDQQVLDVPLFGHAVSRQLRVRHGRLFRRARLALWCLSSMRRGFCYADSYPQVARWVRFRRPKSNSQLLHGRQAPEGAVFGFASPSERHRRGSTTPSSYGWVPHHPCPCRRLLPRPSN